MNKVEKLLKELENKFVYDIAKGQYELMKKTGASNEDYERFADDLQGALRMYN